MKPLLPLVVLPFVTGASCALDLRGLPGEGTGGTTATTASAGHGGDATTTASSSASGTGGIAATTSASSASTSSSTGTGGPVWTRRRKLTLNSGLTSPTPLTDFPVAVLLGKSQIDYTHTLPSGQDIRFTDEQGTTLLDYEIERWVVDESNPSVIWVRIPTLPKKPGNNPAIWMYYGNAQAQGAQNVKGVWNDGFVGVWHLSQDDSNLIDSTGNSPLAVSYGSTKAAGILGDARSFDASAHQYIDTLNKVQLNQFTIEAWGYGEHEATTSNGPNGLLMREKNYQLMWDHVDPFSATANFNPITPVRNGENWKVAKFNGLPKKTWVYLAATFDGDKLVAYKDGLKTDDSSISSNPQLESASAKIGRHAVHMEDKLFFDGSIDEVRISDKARTADWFKSQNKSMRNDSFVTFEIEESGSFKLP